MSITLELPPDVEAKIAEQAQAKGQPITEYLQDAIAGMATPLPEGIEPYLLSETALAKDWLRPEEDAAWQHL